LPELAAISAMAGLGSSTSGSRPNFCASALASSRRLVAAAV
jgi:hypothetical protein